MTDKKPPEPLVLVQEFVNTLDVETGTDDLAGPEGVAGFAARHGLTGLGLAQSDLADLVELRECLRAGCLAHTGANVPEEQAATLRRHLGAAALTLTVDTEGGAALRPAAGLSGVRAFTARLAADIAGSAAQGTWVRLKACEAHDCRWVYYDRSPAGRRRWCAMAVCGSRAKMRSYRARRGRP